MFEIFKVYTSIAVVRTFGALERNRLLLFTFENGFLTQSFRASSKKQLVFLEEAFFGNLGPILVSRVLGF